MSSILKKKWFKIPFTKTHITTADLVIVTCIILFRSAAYDFNNIPSSSMEPTLQIDDHLIVNKHEYSLRLPLTDDIQLTEVTPPEQGEIITFSFNLINDNLAIKRVIAHAGDVVEVSGTDLLINGVKVAHKLVSENEDLIVFRETLNGRSYNVQYHKDTKPNNKPLRSQKWVVPDDHVFVMGDNRDRSGDARYTIEGGIPLSKIHGKAEFILANYNIFKLKAPSRSFIDLN